MRFWRGYFDNAQVKVLGAAIELACEELRISNADLEKREMVALAVLAMAKTGQCDPERLKTYAISQIERTRGRASYSPGYSSPRLPIDARRVGDNSLPIDTLAPLGAEPKRTR